MDKANLKRLLSLIEQHEDLQNEKRIHPEEFVRPDEQFLETFRRLAEPTIVPVLKEIRDLLVGKVASVSIFHRGTGVSLRIKLDRRDDFERSLLFFGDPSTQILRISHEGIGFGLLSHKIPLRDVTSELVEEEALKFLRRLFGQEQLRRPVRVADTSDQRADRLRAALKSRPALDAEISNLERLGDSALWNAAQTRMPLPESERLEELHRKQRLTGLSEAEAQELARLEQQYDRVILVHSHSAFLLEQRGHDIRRLTSSNESRRPAANPTRSRPSEWRPGPDL